MDAADLTGHWLQLLARLSAAAFFGALIGLERELHDKPAGLRTHALVSLGSAVMVVAVLRIAGDYSSSPDAISRVVQGVATGVGFIGGGVILRSEHNRTVHGLTTAAAIWMAAGIGIASGAGHLRLAVAATGLTMVLLVLGSRLERALLGEVKKT